MNSKVLKANKYTKTFNYIVESDATINLINKAAEVFENTSVLFSKCLENADVQEIRN